jgi:hypothetical protein
MMSSSGAVGAAVTIIGSSLSGASNVSFNGTPAAFQTLSPYQISAVVPAGATTGPIQVTTASGTLSSNGSFQVSPTVSKFSPQSGPVGTVVTIVGESLSGASGVWFGAVKAVSVTILSDTQIRATVPAGATTGKITVTTRGGTAKSAHAFVVD